MSGMMKFLFTKSQWNAEGFMSGAERQRLLLRAESNPEGVIDFLDQVRASAKALRKEVRAMQRNKTDA